MLKFLLLLSVFSYAQHVPTTIAEIYDGEIKFNTEPSKGRMEGKWTQGENMPFPRYYGGSVMYERNDTTWLYVFGGDTTGGGVAVKTCLRYNVNTDSWEYIASLPAPMRVNAACRIGDKMFTMGGFDAPFPSLEITKFYEYDVNKNSWEELPELPERVFFHKAFGYQDSLIYILGGMETITRDEPKSRVYIYNRLQRSFSKGTPLLTAVAEFILARRNNSFYVTGGIIEGRELTVTDQTTEATINPNDPTVIDYKPKTNYPVPIRSAYSYYVDNENIYYHAGLTSLSLTPISNSYNYSILQNLYDSEPNTPYPAGAFHSGYSYTQSRSGTDILTVVMAGGVTTGPTITGQTWVYKDTVSATGIKDEEILPSEFVLEQNYPNPFNPSTAISFSLPEESFVRLEIFNSLGEKISAVVSDNLTAGTYNYEWNAGELTSGVYFYRLSAGEFTQTKKLLLLK